MAVQKLGNVNGFVRSIAWMDGKGFEFDGTTKGLVKSAIARGAGAGDIIPANFGGARKENARRFILTNAPHDNRAGGFWAEEL